MASASAQHDDISKRDRILNALAVYPAEYRVSNETVAELTGASASYVYQLRAAIDAGELTADAIESARDDELRSHYRDQLEALLDEANVPRTAEGNGESRSIIEDAMGTAAGQPGNGTVPVEDVKEVRAVLNRYREDASFERDRFEGPGKNIAEEKYFIASRAVDLLDALIEE